MAHILLIEDDAVFREMLTKMLRADQHQVTAASDGAQALALRNLHGLPDLILTDILMPGMDGIETIAELGRLRSQAPIIAMSGGRRSISAGFNLDSAALMGVAATLQKPFTREDLRAAISRVLPA